MYRVLKQCSWKSFAFNVGDVIQADVIGNAEDKLPQTVVDTLLRIGNIEAI